MIVADVENINIPCLDAIRSLVRRLLVFARQQTMIIVIVIITIIIISFIRRPPPDPVQVSVSVSVPVPVLMLSRNTWKINQSHQHTMPMA